jgi:hypothetical protein
MRRFLELAQHTRRESSLMPFESFVRPYQSPGALGRTIIASTPGATKERATLTWGATSDGKIVPARSGTNVECCSSKETEFERETNVLRITQDNEPENWVDVARASKMKLNNKHKNECASEWDQMSGVAFGTSEALAEFEMDMEFAGDNTTDEQCKHEITYKPNTRPAAAAS